MAHVRRSGSRRAPKASSWCRPGTKPSKRRFASSWPSAPPATALAEASRPPSSPLGGGRPDIHVEQHRRRDEHRRIGADHDAEQHDRAQSPRSPSRRTRRAPAATGRSWSPSSPCATWSWFTERSRSSSDRHGLVAPQQFAGAVEHHHGLVQRVADDGQDRRDRGQVELELRDQEEADGQHDVVQRAEDRADRQLASRSGTRDRSARR
jgi:hypothetical protein